ncbi:hypothetical protein IAU59_007608 [Kwoniella sp. CBS 9459]
MQATADNSQPSNRPPIPSTSTTVRDDRSHLGKRRREEIKRPDDGSDTAMIEPNSEDVSTDNICIARPAGLATEAKEDSDTMPYAKPDRCNTWSKGDLHRPGPASSESDAEEVSRRMGAENEEQVGNKDAADTAETSKMSGDHFSAFFEAGEPAWQSDAGEECGEGVSHTESARGHRRFAPVYRMQGDYTAFNDFVEDIFSEGSRYGIVKVILPSDHLPRSSSAGPSRWSQRTVDFNNQTITASPVTEQDPSPMCRVQLNHAKKSKMKLYESYKSVVDGPASSAVPQRDNTKATPPPLPAPRSLTLAEFDQTLTMGACLYDADFNDDICLRLETKFWDLMRLNGEVKRQYGLEQSGSFFPNPPKRRSQVFNMRSMSDLLGHVLQRKVVWEGINVPMYYVGQERTCFGYRQEDLNFLSVNLLHTGAPKVWWGIPEHHRSKFEDLMHSLYRDEHNTCPSHIRHKEYLPSPDFLNDKRIDVTVIYQRQGEMVLTFPLGYHGGINIGWNLAEAVNLATASWEPYGRIAHVGSCEVCTSA